MDPKIKPEMAMETNNNSYLTKAFRIIYEIYNTKVQSQKLKIDYHYLKTWLLFMVEHQRDKHRSID